MYRYTLLKILPLPQKVTKIVCLASCATTWPLHLQFASYATEATCRIKQ